jgi:hypothetical protein
MALSRTEAYNKAIEDLKNAQPNYDELAKLWTKLVVDRMTAFYTNQYAIVGLLPTQINGMVTLDSPAYRAKFSDEEFRIQLDQLHAQSIGASVKQLEFERDNPTEAGTAKPENPDEAAGEDMIGDALVEALATWVINRISDNVMAAQYESGDGAKILRGTLGISVKDIEKYGILGGDNSYLRKIIPTWSDGGGLLGGENSFFRHNLGLSW